MIGVVSKAEDVSVVEEFFELFKTPWETYQPGRSYDVVIVTADEVPAVEANLLVVYGPGVRAIDAGLGISAGAASDGLSVNGDGTWLPIYGDAVTFAESRTGTPCLTAASGIAGVRIARGDSTVIRLGYDLFREVRFLLSAGQPIEQAHVPTLDLHISMLRNWILDAGIPLLEIVPTPPGADFLVCLTHDIDFVGIRRHCFDHTMWGFVYRSTVGAVRRVLQRRLSIARLMKTWYAVVSLPFVYLGWAKDFWDPFEWYLQVERNLPATYYVIPFKNRSGDSVPGPHGSRRATAYDITDLEQWTRVLVKAGCEIGVHGIDAWNSVDKGCDELARIAAVTGAPNVGVRMHWLLHDVSTPVVLEQAGYAYDATAGYNETVGYRNGTTQVFRPMSARTLLELPLHIQDGALFYPQRLDLSEPEAETRCDELIGRARTLGGVLTVLWHDRSHGPERFWGDFYIGLVRTLKSANAWFCTAGQAVGWFRQRRAVRFERVEHASGERIRLRYEGASIQPPLRVVLHRPAGQDGAADIPWSGSTPVEFDSSRNQPAFVGSPT